jgi:DNA invertase Pin-like site-specific DNA recombinase
LVKTLLEFQALKVDFVSLCEGIDTTAGPSSRTELFTFLQGLAQLEQDVMRSRWPFTTNRERARQQPQAGNAILAETERVHSVALAKAGHSDLAK